MSTLKRRHFLLATGAGIALLATGCRTTYPETSTIIYQETIENVMIAPNDGRILVAGSKYFYMFDKDATLEGVLGASFRKSMHASFGTFTLTDDHAIIGSYKIEATGSFTPYQIWEAGKIGFVSVGEGQLVLNSTIKGVRFTPKAEQKNLPPSINKPYPVQVKSVTTSGRQRSGPSIYQANAGDVVFVAALFVLLALFD